jgi:thiol:disulfide interchange protein DsbA
VTARDVRAHIVPLIVAVLAVFEPGTSLAAVLAKASSSQWRLGEHYVQLPSEVPTHSTGSRVEVVDVFWYSCPHCNDLEPYLKRWEKSKPAYVDFVHVPVQWRREQLADARLYYTLASLGREDLHQSVYDVIHREHRYLFARTDAQTFSLQVAFAVKHGIAGDRFAQAARSERVATELAEAERKVRAYRITTTPSIVINGRFVTDDSRAGGQAQLIALIDYLVRREHERLLEAKHVRMQ